MLYDLIIIGAGPAGITAAVYAARKRINFFVITENIGGQTALTDDIENYTGYQFITGPELATKFDEHMNKYGIKVSEGERLSRIKKENETIIIGTGRNMYRTKTAIIATGARWKELNIPGEREYKNKGLTYCATCDGPLFARKEVAIIGGGNSGLQAAIQMEKIASHVYIIEVGPRLGGDKIVQEKLAGSKKITILTNTTVKAILGDKFLNGIRVSRNGSDERLDVQGVFVEIGLVPNAGFESELEKNERGEIEINSFNETNITGVFAAGDVTDVPGKQIIIAAGEGAKAALSASRYLARRR